MIPAPFEYLAPTTVEDALAALTEHGGRKTVSVGDMAPRSVAVGEPSGRDRRARSSTSMNRPNPSASSLSPNAAIIALRCVGSWYSVR